ncbi:hypothetical protein ABKN59_009993 [Abortiporus biennis]
MDSQNSLLSPYIHEETFEMDRGGSPFPLDLTYPEDSDVDDRECVAKMLATQYYYAHQPCFAPGTPTNSANTSSQGTSVHSADRPHPALRSYASDDAVDALLNLASSPVSPSMFSHHIHTPKSPRISHSPAVTSLFDTEISRTNEKSAKATFSYGPTTPLHSLFSYSPGASWNLALVSSVSPIVRNSSPSGPSESSQSSQNLPRLPSIIDLCTPRNGSSSQLSGLNDLSPLTDMDSSPSPMGSPFAFHPVYTATSRLKPTVQASSSSPPVAWRGRSRNQHRFAVVHSSSPLVPQDLRTSPEKKSVQALETSDYLPSSPSISSMPSSPAYGEQAQSSRLRNTSGIYRLPKRKPVLDVRQDDRRLKKARHQGQDQHVIDSEADVEASLDSHGCNKQEQETDVQHVSQTAQNNDSRPPQRSFPSSIPINEHFPALYRKFPVVSYTEGHAKRGPLGGSIYNEPKGPLDLYTPRFVKGRGTTKVGLCPCCAESVKRGGEGKKLWLSMKFSAFNYHMQYTHGISPVNSLPFSPPTAFRIIARTGPKGTELAIGKHEKSHLMQGKCHKCNKWVNVEGIKDVPTKVKEIFWWKHAAACHKGSTITGETDVFVKDEVYFKALQPSEDPEESD